MREEGYCTQGCFGTFLLKGTSFGYCPNPENGPEQPIINRKRHKTGSQKHSKWISHEIDKYSEE